MSQSTHNHKDARTQLMLDALHAYKDDDNEEYNIEIDQLINEIKGIYP